MRIGLVGYGVGGRYFHAPFIVAAEECELVGVVARAPQRVAEVEQDLPGVPVFGSLGELLDAGVDAVTISTPPQTRRELVLEAIGRGVQRGRRQALRADRRRRPKNSSTRPTRPESC